MINAVLCAVGAQQPEQRISLDQLVRAGGVTVQKLPQHAHVVQQQQQQQQPPLAATNIISDPATFIQQQQPAAPSDVTAPAVVVQKQPAVVYDKPDTTTDEAALPNYQVQDTLTSQRSKYGSFSCYLLYITVQSR